MWFASTELAVKSLLTSIPVRLDRLSFSFWHWRVVVALGITRILDGLEASLIANLGPVLQNAATLHLSVTRIGLEFCSLCNLALFCRNGNRRRVFRHQFCDR